MENVTGRYPWATNDAPAFIGAYRYFVTKCRAIANNAIYVWSPVGNSNLPSYWPGAEYVDWVGLSMYSYPSWEMAYYGKVRGFVEAFSERYNFVKAYNKPIMIAEFGAIDTPSGSISYTSPTARDAWLKAALASAPQFPLLQMFVFFNAQDPAAWGANYPAPDWRLPPWGLDRLPPPGVTW